MSQYIIKDSAVKIEASTINADGTNTYNQMNWLALANTVWSPPVECNPGAQSANTIQLSAFGANATTTVIELQVSLDAINWIALGTAITLTGANATSSTTVTQTWAYIRARSTSVSAATTFSVLIQN